MKWKPVSEGLPEMADRKSTPKHVRYLKKRWKGDPYIAKAVAYYFPDRFKTVEWEDWDDYNEDDFPYTENDTESGTVWLRAGWYIDIDCQKCDGHWSAPIEVVEYLDESAPSNTVEEDAVGFAQHILDLMDENVLSTSNGLIRYNNAYYTIKDLYSLFKQSKDQT